MELPITTPAMLLPAIAILMLGYVNRYLGTANVIRSYRRDHASGFKRSDLDRQLKVLKKRIELSRFMMSFASFALILTFLSMYLLFIEQSEYGQIIFGLSLISMITSILIALYETALSNKSLFMEIEYMTKDKKS